MCTIDPLYCWYFDHIDYWKANPELLKIRRQQFDHEQAAFEAEGSLLREEIKLGFKKAHIFKRPDYFQCRVKGYIDAAGPVKEDRICFACKGSIDT